MKSLSSKQLLKDKSKMEKVEKLKNLLKKPSIVFITGPVHSGKSTLIEMIKDVTFHTTIIVEPRLNHTEIHHDTIDGNLLIECQLDYDKLPGLIKSDIPNTILVKMEYPNFIKSIKVPNSI